MEANRADVEYVAGLVKAAVQPTLVTSEKGHFIVLPGANGAEIVSLEQFQFAEPPAKKHAAVKVNDVAGFAAYFLRFNDEDSMVFGNPAKFTFHGVIDYHRKKDGDARSARHTVTLALKFTQRWETWWKANKDSMTQDTFAIFMEDNLGDIWSPPDSNLPTAADMLEISRKLEATSSYSFSQQTNVKTGERNLSFRENIQATAGPADSMKVPDEFMIRVPVFLNQPAVEIKCRLRFRINGNKLTMWFDMMRVDEMLATEFEGARTALQATIEHDVILGEVA